MRRSLALCVGVLLPAVIVVIGARRDRDAFWRLRRVRGPLLLNVAYPQSRNVKPGPITILGTTGNGGAEVSLDGHRGTVAANGAFVAVQPDSMAVGGRHTLLAVLGRDTARTTFQIVGAMRRPLTGSEPRRPSFDVRLTPRRRTIVWARERMFAMASSDGSPGQTESFVVLPGAKLQATASDADSVRVVVEDSIPIWLPARSLTAEPTVATGRLPLHDPSDDVAVAITSAASNVIDVHMRGVPLGTVLHVFESADSLTIRYASAAIPAAWDTSTTSGTAGKQSIGTRVARRGTTREIALVSNAGLVGYDITSTDSGLTVAIRTPASRLDQLTVVLDPGHPPHGTRGALNTTEAAITMAIARAAQRALATRGIRAVLTHHSAHPMSVAARVRFVAIQNADIVVSIHADAAPDGEDPYSRAGTRAFYLHDHASALAEAVQTAVVARLKTADAGLDPRDLAITRISSAAAILCEVAALTVPEEEAMLVNPAAQSAAGEAIADGIVSFATRHHDTRGLSAHGAAASGK